MVLMQADRSPINDLAHDGFGNWLAGFIDGEGCFGIYPVSGPKRTSLQFNIRMSIKLRADDADILREIHRRTGIGCLGRPRMEGGETPNACPSARWTVNRKQDCVALVQILDRFPLRAKKARDFEIWREAVLTWNRIVWPGKSPAPRATNARLWMQIADAKRQLSLIRGYQDVPLAVAATAVDPDPQLPFAV